MNMNRRQFLGTTAAGASLSCLSAITPAFGATVNGHTGEKPAILGGKPARSGAFPSWPVVQENDEKGLLDVVRNRKWSRSYGGVLTTKFEETYAKVNGAAHCVATANGTSALFASLGGLGVGPGDEVIMPPYTFIATLNVVLLQYALPIFVDSDRETFQIDAKKIEKSTTDRTAAIMPVHLGGNVADMDTILEISKRRKLPVVEDACQAHLAEWRGRKVGSLGDTGCFSFQASKNWNCGEGGAVLCNDAELAERVYAFHNNCRPRNTSSYNFTYLGTRGSNLRLTEFQASLLMSQMERVEAQTRKRTENADYLTSMLKEVPGIAPEKKYEGCTVNAYHLYMLRYDPQAFAGMPRARFMKALSAEGIPCSSGYTPLNKDPIIKNMLASKAYQKIYPPEVLKGWEERNQCPVNDQLCQEAVWFTQAMFLGPRSDMDAIANAIRKIQKHAADVAKV